ncbi:MAG TPA: response regulator [Candidatus Angelobacter sp.]|nr:response regulator [Candidatus Angelobacter sp.]
MTIKTLLLVEDNPGDARLLREMLNQQAPHHIELTHVERMSDAEKCLAEHVVDIVLLDLELPDAKGLESVRRAHAAAPRVPLVVLTGRDDEAMAVRALQDGAQDYLIKGQVDSHELLRALRYAVERKVMEEALLEASALARKSDEQYRLLFESNPNPMWVFDVKTSRFLIVNSAASACYGFSKQEFLGMTIHDIEPVAERDRPSVATEKKAGDQQFLESRKHTKKDGTIMDVEITSRVAAFDGHPATLVLVQDVTLRRNLEETLRQKQKGEAVALLASGIAHDFNNLLGIILGCTELALLYSQEGSPVASKLIDVQTAAQRAVGLTRQLMFFSRQEVTEARILDLNESVAASERFLDRVIGEDIEFSCTFATKPLYIKIDPSHLEQILLNLVVNARDAMPRGGQIRIETALVDLSSGLLEPDWVTQPGPHALLTFTDTGQGMDAATCSKVFEPFFTTKERGKGTGLGLAMCDGIVRQAGGHIAVYSETGVGTTFKIFFPLTSAAAKASFLLEMPVAHSQGETILVTEDEPALRGTIVESLEENGYRVLQCASGAETIAMIDQRHGAIDLLLSDVIMPGMSGAKLSHRVAHKYPRIQVLLMTGYSGNTLSRHGMSRGASVIQKPFTRHALLQRVRTMLDAAKAISKKHKILVIEDEAPSYCELISEVLQVSGFEVLCARDGAMAWVQGLSEPVDLVVVNMAMPHSNGLSICQKLKADPSTAHIAVLVVSGTVNEYDKELAFRAGVNAFLSKPFDRDELLSSIKVVLSEKKGSGSMHIRHQRIHETF